MIKIINVLSILDSTFIYYKTFLPFYLLKTYNSLGQIISIKNGLKKISEAHLLYKELL